MELLKIAIHAREGKENELLQACQLITDQTLMEPGCKDCRVFRDFNNENSITLEQKWERQKILNTYFRSDHFSALFGAMKFLGSRYEIIINNGTAKEGLAAVEKARGA